MKKRDWKPSVLPYYVTGAACLAYGLVFPVYRWWDLLLLAAVGVLAFWLSAKLWPGRALTPEELREREAAQPPVEPATDAERIARNAELYLAALRRCNDQIGDPKLSAQMDRIEEVSIKIFAHVKSHPDKTPQIRKFMNYYLPTTLKLLRSYAEISGQGIEGSNITAAMQRVESAMEKIVPAFEKQLDALFADEALDLGTEASVLETMLAGEGLSGDDFTIDTPPDGAAPIELQFEKTKEGTK